MQPPHTSADQVQGSQEATELSDKTFGNQHKLPVVPLPNLQYTCQTFMEWCSPLLTDDEREQTQQAVDKFARAGGPGEKLHEALIEYARQPGVKSWLDSFWETRYLGRRDPIALNANFTFMFLEQEVSQIQRAVNTIAQALHYKLELDEERIPPAVQKGSPRCMNQNKWLFSATRIPGAPLDSLRAPYTQEAPGPSTAKHILVTHRGNFFSMDVIAPSGKPHSLEDLEQGLLEILAQSASRPEEGACVGHLTTKRRADWGEVRQKLISHHADNAAALDAIETALFAICLDEVDPETNQAVTDNILHGDSGSRWFDKALQFVVFRNGSAGLNIEHCGLDGTTILSLIDTMSTYEPGEVMQKSGAESAGCPSISRIEFNLDDSLKQEVLRARDDFEILKASAATYNFCFADFGASHIKSLGISPDAFAQMSYQLAHYRTRGLVGATYESIATRQYENGRTEAMRVITPEIFDFVSSMVDDAVGEVEKAGALRSAAFKHVKRAHQCQAGQAPEQHLWELLNIYNREKDALGIDEDLPLFDTPGWNKMRHDYLSTSSAPSSNVEYFGFGSTSSECIGIGYILDKDQIRIYFSIPKQHEQQMFSFAENLKAVFHELSGLLERNSQS